MNVEGCSAVQAISDSGASVSIVVVKSEKVREGQPIRVQDYQGRPHVHDLWCDLLIPIGNAARKIRFLVVGESKYDMLISRKAMKEFELKHFDDTIFFGESYVERYRLEEKRVRLVHIKLPEIWKCEKNHLCLTNTNFPNLRGQKSYFESPSRA